MTFEEARAAIAAQYNSADLAISLGSTSKTYSDIPFASKGLTHWVRLSIIHADSRQVGLGGVSSLHRYNGLLFFDIFIENGRGFQPASELAVKITTAFRRKRLGTPNCVQVYTSSGPKLMGQEENWTFYRVTCEFRFDDTEN